MNKNTSSKQPNLQLKTQPKQVLGYLPLAFALPVQGEMVTLQTVNLPKSQPYIKWQKVSGWLFEEVDYLASWLFGKLTFWQVDFLEGSLPLAPVSGYLFFSSMCIVLLWANRLLLDPVSESYSPSIPLSFCICFTISTAFFSIYRRRRKTFFFTSSPTTSYNKLWAISWTPHTCNLLPLHSIN
jgi:hypothetical protein